jgi:DEAD/DEAH box helicase domain-containing protein
VVRLPSLCDGTAVRVLSGYQPSERRKIEQEAFSGRILGLVATNALELGVDIGVLDAVIVCGFPVTLASFVGSPTVVLPRALTFSQRQQIGRAGRRARDSLAIYVADTSGTDSHRPDDLFDKPTPDLIIDLESPLVIEAHLQCAAFEMPLSSDDTCWFGPSTTIICKTKLVRDKEGWCVS